MYNSDNTETWHIEIPGIFRTLTYLKLGAYSEHSKRFKMECFAKIAESYKYFSKALYLRSLAGFWIHLSRNKYSLICRVTYLLSQIQTYSGILSSNLDKFSHIVAYLVSCVTPAYSKPAMFTIQYPVKPYSDIFRTLCNARILRTLAYSECCLFRHIQAYSIMIVIMRVTLSFSL